MSNLTIIFQYQGNNISVQCKSNEVLSDLYKRFGNKVGRNPNELKFYFNSVEVPPCNKTLENLNLQNFYTFNVVENNVTGA